jgi:hypothetical protein
MSDRATLVREADEGFAELRRAITGLSEEALTRVWLGTWGVREILVHISGWHREAIAGFGRVARGDAELHPPGAYDDFDAWNARFVADRTGVKLGDVLTELEASHRDFIVAAAAVPDPHFAPDAPVRGFFEGSGAGHYREHAAQIRAWRQAAA